MPSPDNYLAKGQRYVCAARLGPTPFLLPHSPNPALPSPPPHTTHSAQTICLPTHGGPKSKYNTKGNAGTWVLTGRVHGAARRQTRTTDLGAADDDDVPAASAVNHRYIKALAVSGAKGGLEGARDCVLARLLLLNSSLLPWRRMS